MTRVRNYHAVVVFVTVEVLFQRPQNFPPLNACNSLIRVINRAFSAPALHLLTRFILHSIIEKHQRLAL